MRLLSARCPGVNSLAAATYVIATTAATEWQVASVPKRGDQKFRSAADLSEIVGAGGNIRGRISAQAPSTTLFRDYRWEAIVRGIDAPHIGAADELEVEREALENLPENT